MPNPTEASSLVALHELRNMEQAAESAQLHHALENARSQIAQLQIELERTQRLPFELPAPRPHVIWVQWFGWLGLSAGATMLVGALALWAAMRPQEVSKPTVEIPSLACPEKLPTRQGDLTPVAATPIEPSLHLPSKPGPRWHRHDVLRPRSEGKPLPVKCDGRDPLCGLDLGAIDDLGKKRGKGGTKN